MTTSLINITCGYVESSHVSHVIFTADSAYPTQMEALESLALQLFEEYRDQTCRYKERQLSRRDCCKEARENFEWKYCPMCKADLHLLPDFEDFSEWIRSFHGAISDGLGYIETPWCWWHEWEEIVKLPIEHHLLIPENAEHVIPRAIPADKLKESDAEAWRLWYIETTTHKGIYDSGLGEKDAEWPTDKKLTLDYVMGRRVHYIRSVVGKDFK